MDAFEFTHQIFSASDWEGTLKKFIESLDCSDNIIWHRKRKHKKIFEELTPLGFYVKYRYGEDKNISFKLNETQGKADAWVYKDNKEVESIQIAIAYYDNEELEVDRRTMNGEDFTVGDWVGSRLELLKGRVLKRVDKKFNKDGYQNIDTLLIGVNDFFARRVNTEYQEKKDSVVKYITSYLSITKFKQVALVDVDYIGTGDLIFVMNE